MSETTARIACADGYPLSAKIFAPLSAKAVMVIASALGVPTRFYAAYARFLADQGFATVLFDYRGSGDSARGPQRGRDMRMEDWGRLDLEAVLAWTLRELKPKIFFLTGHSAGGQLVGLAPSSEKLNGVVLVAASAPHLSHYPPKFKPQLALTWYGLVPLLSLGRDNFPVGPLGLGTTTVASGVIVQWARWGRSADYLFTRKHDIDTSCYAQLSMPLLSYCFADDHYATPAAVNALLKHYPRASIENRVVPKTSYGTIGHFGYFRESQRDALWRETLDWLNNR